MMDITWQSNHRHPVDKATKLYWFNKLQHLALGDVAQAFDKWLIETKELPTLKDILNGCRKENNVYARLPAPLDINANKERMADLNNVVGTMTSKVKDYRAWARKIVSMPHNYPALSLKLAQESLNMEN